ncbi:MAG TPA: hypothetical protein VL053_00485 [Arachidicoccus sp.]|nr:hypothetical protein [Arachidicoccus sp.]
MRNIMNLKSDFDVSVTNHFPGHIDKQNNEKSFDIFSSMNETKNRFLDFYINMRQDEIC